MRYADTVGAVSAAPAGWTEARVANLRKLWADGLSASQIAMRLGGVSRNAVIGKVHREQLPGRKTRIQDKPKRRKPRIALTFVRPERRPPPHPPLPYTVAPIEAPPPLLTPLLDLQPQQCRWPVGDPGEVSFAFCGRQADGSYCGAHARAAFQPPARRRR